MNEKTGQNLVTRAKFSQTTKTTITKDCLSIWFVGESASYAVFKLWKMLRKNRDGTVKQGHQKTRGSRLSPRERASKIFSSIIFRFVVVYRCFIFWAYSFSKSCIPHDFYSITIWASIYFLHLPSPLISFKLHQSARYLGLSWLLFNCSLAGGKYWVRIQ